MEKKIERKTPKRLSEPRIRPLEEDEWDEDARTLIDGLRNSGNPVINIVKTLANYSKLYNRWRVFGNHILFKSSLPIREKEILILRIGWLCGSEYEWGQHVIIGKRAGLNDEDIKRITLGADASGWDPFEATLIRAVDELYSDAFISDTTWNALAQRYDTKQLMDVVFTIGQYNLVSWALNTFGVQREKGLPGFPD
ncbi:MAG: carboxymuconolactone decarboxylase family protein [Promethearchaeota archaeon]